MIVVFDATCLVCNYWVQFLLKHDKHAQIQFADMHGRTGQRLLSAAGLDPQRLETLLVVDGLQTWRHTAAVLQVLHSLGWPWRAAWGLWLVPSPLRDALYRWIARNRHRFFGTTTTCLRPTPAMQSRFLD